ncbi:MAG: aminotransferase class I/II-fold pyridoxal phosphate-dependent enzyme [Flavobacterium sp.]|nr:aminotransferase class I/II-fold pyridoxal phosphate-dependent enzyme [Flavobacterium sp.]
MSNLVLSKLAASQQGSEIVKLGNAISERIRNGEPIFNYTIGDFDPSIFPIPKAFEDAIIDAYKHHYTNYPPADGIIELRKSVSEFLKDWEGLDYAPNEIQIAAGGRPLIYTIFKVLVDVGDKVIYAAPSWNNNHYTNMNHAEHCVIETSVQNNFMPTANDIAKHIKGTTLICLCTPQNPTGTTLQKHVLAEICDLIITENNSRGEGEKKCYLMFDQMYWMLTYGTTEHYNPITLRPEMKAYTLFVDGISKVLAATGVRVGWALGPAEIMVKIKAILGQIGAWAPMAEQKALANYLPQTENIKQYLTHFKAAMEERLVAIYNGFMALKAKGFAVDAVAPQAAIYLTIQLDLAGKKTPEGKLLSQQTDVTEYILSEAKLAVVPFTAFGTGNSSWYRLSVGTCKTSDIPVMLAQLESTLEKLI